MMWRHSERVAALALLAGLSWLGAANGADRPAEKIVEEIRGVEMPQLAPVDRSNRQAVQAFLAKRQAAMEKKADLIGELYKQHPEAPELAQLLPERWQALASAPATAATAQAEMDRVISSSKNDTLVAEASFLKLGMAFRDAGQDDDKVRALLPAVDAFAKRFPKDERTPMILAALAGRTRDDATRDTINKRIEKDYPDSQPAQMIAGERKQREAIGKPFAISFTEAIKGGTVDSASLKGKVVVVDFWATWCGPCVAEMPKMKALYAQYKDKGVEFVGVSLDRSKEDGGYDSLREFVEKNKIEWPQFYQGNYWDSEFSKSWGINGIPAVFLVDAEGNLVTTEARGRLETLIPEQLAKAKKDKKAE